MARSNARRVTGARERAPAPPAGTAVAAGPADRPAQEFELNWRWQLVLFLWASSFVSLALYEFLTALFRAMLRGGG